MLKSIKFTYPFSYQFNTNLTIKNETISPLDESTEENIDTYQTDNTKLITIQSKININFKKGQYINLEFEQGNNIGIIN